MSWLDDIRTPAAIVHLDRVESNVGRMAQRARGLGVRLRPHVKTHKCVEAGRLQTEGQFGGITVSTYAEALGFARAGFRDITWAVPIASSRFEQAADLACEVERLTLLVDHPWTVDALSEYGLSRGMRFDVMLKVDCGNHRVGVDPAAPDSMKLAKRAAASAGLRFRGVLAHAGHAYGCKDMAEVRAVARQERDTTVAFADRLRSEGVEVETVSVGSTPTMVAVDSLAGVTEIRPGNYVFFDVFQWALGSCELTDMALSVVSTVVGLYPDRDTFVIDAGALALSKDPGATQIDTDSGFGRVEVGGGLRVRSLTQEHGVVWGLSRAPEVRVGTRVLVYPNHSCLTAAMHGEFHVERCGEKVGEWFPIRGWNS